MDGGSASFDANPSAAGGLTPWERIPTIGRMDDELQALEQRIDRLVAALSRLAESNQALRTELAQASRARAELESRMLEARSRVSSALERLPGAEPIIGMDDREAAH